MELTLDPLGGAWVTCLVAAVLLVAPWVLPPRAIGLSPERRRTLQILRTVAAVVLLFAWIRPTVIRVKTESIRPALSLLIDGSVSMTVEDSLGEASRWDATRRLLDASAASLARLAETRDVRAYLFDRGLNPLTLNGGRLNLPAAPAGEQTALGAALADALDAAGGAKLSGVIVVSDGAQRARPPRDAAPLAAVPRLLAQATPFYGVTVGQRATGDRADIAIEDLLVSDAVFAAAPFDAQATLRVRGFANRPVRVRLLWEDAEGQMAPVDAAQITVRQGADSYPIRLCHTPATAGEWKLSIIADTFEGETLTDNNAASTFVTVRAGGVRVLQLAGTTRPGGAPGLEQQFVRSSLQASPDLAVERVIINYEPTGRDLTARLGPGAADVVIVDNVDALGLSRESWRALANLVESGAGLAMIGGRQSFGAGGHRDTLGAVLPVTPGRAERQRLSDPKVREDVHLPGPLRIAPARRHPILDLPSDGAGDPWAELPPLLGANRLGASLKPSAVVLATTDDPVRPQPLIVAGQAGLGRSLALAGDSTWQWPLAGFREEHQRFWRQAVLWLAQKDDDRSNQVYVDLPTRRVPAGTRVDVTAGVRLSSQPEASASGSAPLAYTATVLRPDGTTIDLPMPGQGVRTTGVLTDTAQAGDYRVRVTATRGGETLGAAEARFLVPRRDLELERPGAEPDTLARLAKATAADGGRTVALEELPTLLAELAAEAPEERREVIARTTLYDTWPVLLLFAGLMTAEWLVRRGAGMP